MGIIIYWWNFGKKTKEFEGSYEEYFKKKDIRVRRFKRLGHNDNVIGLRFRVSLSSGRITLDSVGDRIRGYGDIITLFLTLLGDRALFIDGRGGEHKINWH